MWNISKFLTTHCARALTQQHTVTHTYMPHTKNNNEIWETIRSCATAVFCCLRPNHTQYFVIVYLRLYMCSCSLCLSVIERSSKAFARIDFSVAQIFRNISCILSFGFDMKQISGIGFALLISKVSAEAAAAEGEEKYGKRNQNTKCTSFFCARRQFTKRKVEIYLGCYCFSFHSLFFGYFIRIKFKEMRKKMNFLVYWNE